MRKIPIQQFSNMIGVSIHYFRSGKIWIDGRTYYIEDFSFLEDPGIEAFGQRTYILYKPEVPDKTNISPESDRNYKYLQMLHSNGIFFLGDLRYEAARNYGEDDFKMFRYNFLAGFLGENLTPETKIAEVLKLNSYNIIHRGFRKTRIVISELHEFGLCFPDEINFVPPTDYEIRSKIERTKRSPLKLKRIDT